MAIIADEDFQEEKCRATYALDFEATVHNGSPREFLVQTRRDMPTEHLPDIARGFIGDRFTIHETQSWTGPDSSGAYVADLRVHVQGAPINGTGQRRLTPAGKGTEDVTEIRIKASIPLIGRRIEEAAAPAVKAAAEIEAELLARRT